MLKEIDFSYYRCFHREYIPRIVHMVYTLLCFIVVRHLLILPICFRVASLALGKSYDCPSASEATLKNMAKYITVFYLKFFEHPSFGQVAHEIYPPEWKVHSSEISITIMYCWYMFLMAVATDFTHVTINLVCCCLSPVLISHKRSCWKISQSQTHMIGCWNACTAFF